MAFLTTIKDSFKRSVEKEPAIIIYSVIISIGLWFVVSMNIYPNTTITMKNIPVKVTLNGVASEDSGLDIVSQSAKTVTVTLVGNRAKVGDIKAEDVKATVSAENVNVAGEYEFSVVVTNNNEDVPFEVQSISPKKVSVVVDSYETRDFDVTADTPNVTIGEGLYRDSLICDPTTISIYGAKTQLDKISKCVATASDKLALDASRTLHTSDIVLYGEDGTVIDNSLFKIQTADFTIDIPVYLKKTLDLDYVLKNAPSYFNTNILNFELSADNITVAGNKSAIEGVSNYNVGYISLSDINIGSTFEFDIDLPSTYKNLSNLTTVTATLVTDGLAKKTMTISKDQFSIINSSASYNVLTDNLEVTVIGPEEDINNITPKDIVGEINLLDTGTHTGSFDTPVTPLAPNYKNVWIYGSYKATIEAVAETTTTTVAVPNNVNP